MTLRYCLHPGFIRSKNDNDVHYITASQLIRAYRLPHDTYVRHSRNLGCRNLIPLRPIFQGNYTERLAELETENSDSNT